MELNNFYNTLQKDNDKMILHIDVPDMASLQIDVTSHREEIIKRLPFDSIEMYFVRNKTCICRDHAKDIVDKYIKTLLPILHVTGWSE